MFKLFKDETLLKSNDVGSMYIQQDRQPVYKLKYFTPDIGSGGANGYLKNTQRDEYDAKSVGDRTKVKSFLEPGDDTFANIRKRLSTLSVTSGYNKGLEYAPPPVFRERRLPPRRVSSISSRDTAERGQEARGRLHSRASFNSDDKEFRRAKLTATTRPGKDRASETAAVAKLTDNVITAGQNPELFSRQIQINNQTYRPTVSRSTSPKSVRSVDSSGKVHLGLIESLDLNEKLKDVERIKERYSNDQFMNSLLLYKLRGHDRCFHPDFSHSSHIARGTKLADSSRSDSKLSMDSSGSQLTFSTNASFGYFVGNNKWEPDKSHVYNQLHAQPRGVDHSNKRKKCVEFNMTPKEHEEDSQSEAAPPPTREGTVTKTPRSILKRTQSDSYAVHTQPMDSEDEFLATAGHRWRFQLPKIHSPNSSLRTRPVVPFKRKMYHFGDGISEEFEQVIARYGNCRQNSYVKDRAFAPRDGSFPTHS